MNYIFPIIMIAMLALPAAHAAGGGDYELQEKVYRQALKYQDYNTAAYALHMMIALKPEKTELKDTLAALYFETGAFLQCLNVSKDILKSDPEKESSLELAAVSSEAIGDLKSSLAFYEKLYPISKHAGHLYQIASVQFRMQRIGEAKNTAMSLVQIPESDPATVIISVNNQVRQKVPVKAAALNLLGVIALEFKEFEAARSYFKNALDIYPDFVLAKNNIDFIDQLETEGK